MTTSCHSWVCKTKASINGLLIYHVAYTDLPLAPGAGGGGGGNSGAKQTKITKYVKSVCPSVARKTDNEDDYNDDSVALKDILLDDKIGSIALQDMETTAPKRSVDDNFLISKFLSADGRQHVIVLYNLLSGIRLDTVKTKVTHGGMCLTVSHAFCPSFHDIEKLQSTIQDNEILMSDKDDNIRFRSIHEVSRMMKGDITFVCGDKTISLPIQCQDVPFLQCAIKTFYGE